MNPDFGYWLFGLLAWAVSIKVVYGMGHDAGKKAEADERSGELNRTWDKGYAEGYRHGQNRMLDSTNDALKALARQVR